MKLQTFVYFQRQCMVSLCILFCLFSTDILAQEPATPQNQSTNYTNITLSGLIPKDFTNSTAKKYDRDKKKISKDNKRSVRLAEEYFYQESNFIIAELLRSGKVFYDDPITQYVNKVADELLKDDPKLRKEIRIYTVKNPSANALTTNDGIIFVNWGLLERLENEAQLAYVLAHEITHYRDEHVIDNFLESTKIQQGVGVYKRSSYLDRVTAQTNYSKDLETSADLEGLELYLKTNYSTEATTSLFDILAYVHTPFDDKEINLDFFSIDSLFQFPANYKFDPSYNPIEVIDDEDSKTHPGLTDRKTKITDEVKGLDESGKQLFIVGENAFKEVQKMARYEIGKVYLYYQNYPMAIYHNWLLLQNDPNNKYLHKNIIKGVYAIAKFKNYYEYDDLVEEYEVSDIQGKSKFVYDFFTSLHKEESTVLALSMTQQYLNNYDKNDVEILKLREDLVKELVVANDYTTKSFKNRTHRVTAGKDEDELPTFNLSFVAKDSELKKLIAKIAKKKKSLKNNRAEVSDREYSQFRDKLRKKGYRLNINKLVIVDPFYLKIDTRKRYPRDYIASEIAQEYLGEKIKENADLLGMRTKVLSSLNLTQNSSEKFEDIAFLNTWISERLGYGRVDMVSIDYEQVQELSKTYKTSNFLWSGAVGLTESNAGAASKLFYALFFPPVLPRAIGPENYTYYYTLLFDLEEEQALIYDYNLVKMKDSDANLHSNIYYNLWQISRK